MAGKRRRRGVLGAKSIDSSEMHLPGTLSVIDSAACTHYY